MEGERKAVVLLGYKVRDVGTTFFVMPRSEIWTVRKPKTVSKRLKSSFRAPDLRAMLHMHRGEERQDRRVGMGALWYQGLNWYSFKERMERRRVFGEGGILLLREMQLYLRRNS